MTVLLQSETLQFEILINLFHVRIMYKFYDPREF